MSDSDQKRLESIDNDNEACVFPDNTKRWLCDLVRRLDAELTAYRTATEPRKEPCDG